MAAADGSATANATDVDQIPDFIHEIFYPTPLSSFRESMPSGELNIILHRQPDQPPKMLRLINMFPFMTLRDIKLAICLELKYEFPTIPDYIYLCLHGETPGLVYAHGTTAPLDFTWNFPGLTAKQPLRIASPYKLASGLKPADARFVDSGGDRKLVSSVDRERMTIEDACFKKGVTRGIPELHAYLYADLLDILPGPKPPSEKEWNGRLYPMFPKLSVSSVSLPTPEQRTTAERQAVVFLRRQQFMVKIESILESKTPLISLTMAAIKYLQLTWESKKQIRGIETQFYDAAVTERRPFLRLIPTEGNGLSKVYLSDGKAPDIQDPKLLIQWSQDRSPTPEQDYAFGKIMLRKGLMNVPPIYATLRLFNDGTADLIVEPPKGVKKLEPRNDLSNLGAQIVDGLQDLPYITDVPEIGKGMFVLGLRARKDADAMITSRILHERLPIFSAMFQEITPLPGEKPLAMLRFKLVSNFAREDRIQTFLTQVINRKVLQGEHGIGDLINLVAEEFQIDTEEARKQVSIKLENQGEVALVVPETKEYMRQNNTGIDVAIFAQHPFYTFHLYNVNSLENLQRIITALSILISADSDTLQVGTKAVKELLTAETRQPAPVPEEVPEAVISATPEPTEDAGDEEVPEYLDFFAFEKDTTEAVQEEAFQEEVVAAAKLEGAAKPEAPLDRNAPQAAVQTKDIRKELAASVAEPRQELANASTTSLVSAAANNTGASSETGIANFFLKKLQDADRRLFDYTKSHPALKRYVSQCQPTYGRQPAVLSEEKFQEMREEYAKDNISFQIYPLQPGEPQKLPGVVEVDYFTVLRYGSSPDRQNYYLCSKYFCTRDEILIREKDLKSKTMRRGIRLSDGSVDMAKLPGQCPFCKGTLIKNRQHPGPNETILERVVKPPTADKRHLYIGFLKKTPHPEGFYLPCCFTEDLPIAFAKNPAFEKYKEWGTSVRPTNPAAAALLEDEEDLGPEVDLRAPIDYSTVLDQAAKKYIVGAEKLPLDIGASSSAQRAEPQIGLLPLALNPYFDQEPSTLVSRAFNPQKIQPGGRGFLRVAVENRHRFQNDSFLAAIAPFYDLNSALQMKQLIIGAIQPPQFLALNYGNLAIEFYDPSDPRPSLEALRAWSSKYLHVDMQQENQEALMRAYMSYIAFQEWLLSDTHKKEYRQFALLLSQSNLLRPAYPAGITFIVIDILKNGAVSTRCSPYGFNPGLMGKNDIAFLLHHWSGIWEPIFYVDNREAEVRQAEQVLSRTLVFQWVARAAWPPIIKERLREYVKECSSSSLGIYTSSQKKMHSRVLIPASLARARIESDKAVAFDGIIRDAYNHIGALVFYETAGDHSQKIAVPVVDDGELIIGKNLYMDWEDPSFTPAPMDKVLQFYKTHVSSHFSSLYSGYSPKTIIKSKESGLIEAIQLRNRLYVPVSPPTPEAAEIYKKSETAMVQEMVWSKNHEICLEEGDAELPNEAQRISALEFQEVFEHLRLTFSNWLASREDGGELRRTLEQVIFSGRLPLYEKRKRMEMLLGREIENWITTDFADEDDEGKASSSLLRVDCRVKGQEECNGRCVWKQDAEEGKCLIHVPKQTELGEDPKKVSAPRVLLLRLIEELLRYGERRRQLFDQDVARLATLDRPVAIDVPGSVAKQMIYPEKSAAWYELLRLEWVKEESEKPKFLEEMSRRRGTEPVAELNLENKLPERLITLLGANDPKTAAFRLLRAPFDALLMPLRIRPRDIGVQDNTIALSDSMLMKITQQTLGRVIQIDLRFDPPGVTVRRPIKSVYEVPTIPIFIITEEGPGILVLNPDAPELFTVAEMPSGLVSIMEKKFAERLLPLERAPPNINLQRPLPSAIAAAPVKSSRVAAAMNSRNVNRQMAKALSPKILAPLVKPQAESNSEIVAENVSPASPPPQPVVPVAQPVVQPAAPVVQPVAPVVQPVVPVQPVAPVVKPVVPVVQPAAPVVQPVPPPVVPVPPPVVQPVQPAPPPLRAPSTNSETEFESLSPRVPPPQSASMQKLIPAAPDPFMPPPPRAPLIAPPKVDSVPVPQAQPLRPQVPGAVRAVPPKPQWEGPPKAPRPPAAQLPPGLARLFKKPAAEAPPPVRKTPNSVQPSYEEILGESPANKVSLIPPPPSYAPPEGFQQARAGKLPLPRKLAPIQGTTSKQGPNWLNTSE